MADLQSLAADHSLLVEADAVLDGRDAEQPMRTVDSVAITGLLASVSNS